MSERKSYSNYDDAIFYEVDQPISEKYNIEEPSDEYDIDSIADEVIGFANGQYGRKVSEKDFWEIVGEYAI
jgi:hypothetical protein